MVRTVTALKIQKRNPRRVNVYLDGEFAFGLEGSAAAWLKIGQELADEKINQLQTEDEAENAYKQALRLLNYRPRTEAEVRKKLEQRGTSEATILAVLERLRRTGLVNDERFARDWVENRNTFRPRSRKALAIEMRQHGLNQETIEKAIAELDDEPLAYQAAQKHSRKLNGLDWQAFRKKMTGFLARRGFRYDVIAPVVKRIWTEDHTDKLEEDEL